MSIVQRARLLTLTEIHCINGDLAPGVFLAARAHFEVTALLAHLLRQGDRYLAGEVVEGEFAKMLTRLHLGRKHGLESLPAGIVAEDVTAVNVLTCLDSVDRLLAAAGSSYRGAFRDGYEWLLEFCHPNGFSRVGGSGQRIVGRDTEFEETPRLEAADIDLVLLQVRISHQVFFKIHELVLGLIVRLAKPDR